MRKQLKSLFRQYGIKKNQNDGKKTEAEPRKKYSIKSKINGVKK